MRAGVSALATISTALFSLSLTDTELHEGRVSALATISMALFSLSLTNIELHEGQGQCTCYHYLQHYFPSPSLTQNCMRAGVSALVIISTGLFYLSLTNIELHEGRGEERQGQLMHEEGLVDLDGLGLHHGLHDEDHLHHLGQQVGVADVVLGAHHHNQQLQDGPRAWVCQNIRHVTVNKREKNLTNGKGQAVLSARTSGM